MLFQNQHQVTIDFISKILFEIQKFLFKKMSLKMSSALQDGGHFIATSLC